MAHGECQVCGVFSEEVPAGSEGHSTFQQWCKAVRGNGKVVLIELDSKFSLRHSVPGVPSSNPRLKGVQPCCIHDAGAAFYSTLAQPRLLLQRVAALLSFIACAPQLLPGSL